MRIPGGTLALLALMACGPSSAPPAPPVVTSAEPPRAGIGPTPAPVVATEPALVLHDEIDTEPPDPCAVWSAESVVRFVPLCDVHESERFYPWPGNVVELPSEAGLGSCHDLALTVHASATPGVACPVRALRLTEANTRVHGAGRYDSVQIGVLDLPIAVSAATLESIRGVAADRIALSLYLDESAHPFDLARLAPLAERLTALFLHGSAPIDLAGLPQMPHLVTLVIAGPARRISGIASLARQPELIGLGLHGEVSPEEGAAIAQLHLRDLGWVGNHPLVLPQLTGIESLRIAGTYPNLAAIRGWTSLRRLVLTETSSDLGLAHVTGMASLRVLSVPLGGLGARSVRALARRTDLTSLVIHFSEGDELPEPPAAPTEDEPFVLEAPPTPSPWTALTPLTRLEGLDLDVTDWSMLPIGEPRWLRWLCRHHEALRHDEACPGR